MLHKAWNSKGEMLYCFPRSSIKFQGHTVQNITDFDPNWAFPDYRPVAAFKSLRFALLTLIFLFSRPRIVFCSIISSGNGTKRVAMFDHQTLHQNPFSDNFAIHYHCHQALQHNGYNILCIIFITVSSLKCKFDQRKSHHFHNHDEENNALQ